MKTIVEMPSYALFVMPEKDVSTFLEIMKRCQPLKENWGADEENRYHLHPEQKFVNVKIFTKDELGKAPSTEPSPEAPQ